MAKVFALVASALVLIAGCGSDDAESTGTTTSVGRVATSTSSTVAQTTTTTTVRPPFPYLYVWPFRDAFEAQEWQRSYRSGGHQPWHLDAGATAEAFTSFLGVHEQIGEVIKVTEDDAEAHVAMGFHNPNRAPVVATTLHLARVGSGPDAPWEVVGDDQTSHLTLTKPASGAVVSSPIAVGGRATGVDERIRVRVYQPSEAGQFIGERCCLPAGGVSTPWSTTVAYSGAVDQVLVITASTGGHLQDVEELAFTAVRRND
jgi:hypothetical protein